VTVKIKGLDVYNFLGHPNQWSKRVILFSTFLGNEYILRGFIILSSFGRSKSKYRTMVLKHFSLILQNLAHSIAEIIVARANIAVCLKLNALAAGKYVHLTIFWTQIPKIVFLNSVLNQFVEHNPIVWNSTR